jgi:pyridinium-3,5-bisthiocarboxylic acid mononucleotide nickel chelatase
MVSSTVLIMVNVDDVTGETVPYLFETLMNMGAMNVHAIPAFTKKGRQELIFLIDTPREKITEIGDFLVGELGTLGLRVFEESEHIEFDYQVKESRLIVQDEATGEDISSHTIAVKLIRDSQGRIAAAKAEYEHLKNALEFLVGMGVHVSLVTLKKLAESAVLEGKISTYRNVRVEP